MISTLPGTIRRHLTAWAASLDRRLHQWTKPLMRTLVGGAVADTARTKTALLAENALLRQQRMVLQRQLNRPSFAPHDRLLLVVLARLARTWRSALLVVQPDTLLRWHRQGYRLGWRVRSAPARSRPHVAPGTVALIQQMAAQNRLWGAERIRGALLKLGIHVGKRTVQRYMRAGRPPRGTRQAWATLLHTHAHNIWACDFLPAIDLGFRALYAFFIVELASRRVVHVGVTRHPSDAWMAQQVRAATPFGMAPRFLIRDKDRKVRAQFTRVAAASGIEILRTPIAAPRANAIGERLLGSVRRECLDHLLILHKRQLRRVLRAYSASFNTARPHQGIRQFIPDLMQAASAPLASGAAVCALPVVEPEHWLVARTLERAWEEKLVAQQQLEEEYHRFVSQQSRVLTAHERAVIRRLARDIPALWAAPTTTAADRKEIIRQVVDRMASLRRDGASGGKSASTGWAGGRRRPRWCAPLRG